MTDRKKTGSQLRRAQKRVARSKKLAEIGRLASDISHELRNSLTAIKNAVYYFKEISREHNLGKKDPAVIEVLEHAEKEIRTATAIISNWLDFVSEPSHHEQLP